MIWNQDTSRYFQVFQEPTLNGFMSLGCAAWNEARQVLQHILSDDVVIGEGGRERGVNLYI